PDRQIVNFLQFYNKSDYPFPGPMEGVFLAAGLAYLTTHLIRTRGKGRLAYRMAGPTGIVLSIYLAGWLYWMSLIVGLVVLYTKPRAAWLIAVSLLVLAAERRLTHRPITDAEDFRSRYAYQALLVISAFAFAVNAVGLPPLEIIVALILVFFVWRLRRFLVAGPQRTARTLLMGALAYLFTFTLLGPDTLSSFAAYASVKPNIRWIYRDDNNTYKGYDVFPVGDELIVTGSGSKAGVIAYSAVPGMPTSINPGGSPASASPQRGDVGEDGREIYLANYDSGPDVEVIDRDLNIVRAIDTPDCDDAIYVQHSPHTGHIYYTCEGNGAVIDADPLTGETRVIDRLFAPNVIKASTDRRQMYVAPLGGREVVRYDVVSGERVEKPCAPGVLGISHDAARGRIYLSEFARGRIEVRDDTTLDLLDTWQTQLGTRDSVFDPAHDRLYAGNYFTGTISVIDPDHGPVGYLYAGPRVRGLEYDAATDRLYFVSTLDVGFYPKVSRNFGYIDRGDIDNLGEVVAALAVKADRVERRLPLEYVRGYATLSKHFTRRLRTS
ncbi:hypothetical protein KDL45_13580, partial [bacterium]|nr:hypothetical protein [bacterium]